MSHGWASDRAKRTSQWPVVRRYTESTLALTRNPLVAVLRRWVWRGPLAEPFEPYARALSDHWARKRPVRFYLRGTFGPFARQSSTQGFEPMKHRRDLEKAALALCRGRVLDAGAGTGRHSLLLREAGLDVVSIDMSPILVELMKQRGLDQVYQADIFTADHGVFDTILFLQNTIGLTGTLDRLRELLAVLRPRLDPRGQIVLDSVSPRYIAAPLKYPGEGQMQILYRSLLGRPFPWLWVDFSALSVCARAAGYDAELMARGPIENEYLARLTPRQEASG